MRRREIEAKFDGLDSEPDDDRDHLMELHEVLERLEDTDEDNSVDEEVYRRKRFAAAVRFSTSSLP